MYSPRQRDLRERRHQHVDEIRIEDELDAVASDESIEFESTAGWGIQLSARAGAA
jgi:hypothetical protein